jgi:hypothetical protein
MNSTAAASFVAFLLVGSMFVPSEASARSAGISQRAVAPRALSPAGTQCFGVGCGLPGAPPPVTNSFPPPQIGMAPLRRHHQVFRHRLPSYGAGFTYGDSPLVDSTYPAYSAYSAPDGAQQIDSEPRGCYSRDYLVPSENYGSARTVTVTRCYGM